MYICSLCPSLSLSVFLQVHCLCFLRSSRWIAVSISVVRSLSQWLPVMRSLSCGVNIVVVRCIGCVITSFTVRNCQFAYYAGQRLIRIHWTYRHDGWHARGSWSTSRPFAGQQRMFVVVVRNDLHQFLPERDYVTFGYMLSQICLSSVTVVRPTQPVEIFSNVSTKFCTLANRRPPSKILRRSPQGIPPSGVNAISVANIIAILDPLKAISRKRCKIRPRIENHTRRISWYHFGPSDAFIAIVLRCFHWHLLAFMCYLCSIFIWENFGKKFFYVKSVQT